MSSSLCFLPYSPHRACAHPLSLCLNSSLFLRAGVRGNTRVYTSSTVSIAILNENCLLFFTLLGSHLLWLASLIKLKTLIIPYSVSRSKECIVLCQIIYLTNVLWDTNICCWSCSCVRLYDKSFSLTANNLAWIRSVLMFYSLCCSLSEKIIRAVLDFMDTGRKKHHGYPTLINTKYHEWY